MDHVDIKAGQGLKYLTQWPPVHLTFEEVVSTVTDDNGKNKMILSGVSGCFKSGHLTAILGGSGSGKTTLLNSLAGFKCQNVTGIIAVNGKERNMKTFRRISRYIMQQDIVPSMLTVQEVMTYAADLKLGFNETTTAQKVEIIDEVLLLLRLSSVAYTPCMLLSGGELKRLSIAMELVNNPPVLFLDEVFVIKFQLCICRKFNCIFYIFILQPTTGLDDYSGLKCIELLRDIAHGGRTIVCSIHTPSARMFEMFDHVYVVAKGKCAYQGRGQNIIQFVDEINIACPKHYNPADFIVELASGEYGNNYIERMIEKIDNGRVRRWKPLIENTNEIIEDCDPICLEISPSLLKSRCTSWQQFVILFKRESTKIYRNRTNVFIQICMHIFVGLVIGGMFWQFGNDPTKTIFNFGFCFTVIIAFLYIPMMPVLCFFPSQVQTLKREYFNCWYRLSPYYCAINLARAPLQLANGLLYLTMVYLLTDQPLEFKRMALFYIVSLLVSLTSEGLGVLVSSSLSIIISVSRLFLAGLSSEESSRAKFKDNITHSIKPRK
ncbi:unnamed protein product [Diamesa serratosioi]